MTEQEKQTLKQELLEDLLYDALPIEALEPEKCLTDEDKFELNGGRNISFDQLCSEINAKIGGSLDTVQIKELIELFCSSRFLSKLKDDRSAGKVASDKGFEVGSYLPGVSGAIIGKDAETGQTFGEMDRLFIRIKAYFETLTIINAETLAGKQYITPGGGVKCTSVGEVKDAQGTLTGWRCYFLSEQDGEKTETKMIVGDQAISEMFNAKEGTSNKVSNHRYWRLVTAVEQDAYTDDSGNHYGYIELSASNCEAGSDAPEAGDEICQLGYQGADKPERQTAMVFSTVDADAPSIKMLSGIGSGNTLAEHYSLADKAIISFGRDPITNKVYFRLGNSTATQYLQYTQNNGLKVAGSITTTSTIGDKTLNQYFTDLIPEISQEDIEGYVNAIVDPKIEGIQNQIDGVIETWFYNGLPTLSNYPASEWSTENLKIQHLGDLYYDNNTGTAYRFSQSAQGGFFWNVITDDAITKALAAAQAAQDTADGKRRTFVNTPVPPYDDGDIWVNATYAPDYSNDILRCVTSKAEGQSFAISDWTLASKYTDDTLAQEAKDEIAGYQYIKTAFKGASVTNGGLFLSTLIELGLWDEDSLQTDHPKISQVYAGLNGAFINEKSPMLWGGGDMVDRFFDANGNLRTTPLATDFAKSMIRMDGSAYLGGGAHVFNEDGSGFLANGNITWDASGIPTIGSNVIIKISESETLNTALSNLTTHRIGIDNLFTVVENNDARTEHDLSWAAITENKSKILAIKAKYGFVSVGEITGYVSDGYAGANGNVGVNSLFALSDVLISNPAVGQALIFDGSKWVNQAVSGAGGLDETQLADYLTNNSYATQQWVDDKGYLTNADFGNYLYAFGDTDFDPATYDGYYAGMITKSGITTDWWHILSMNWGTTQIVNNKIWASQLALPTRTSRGLRYRTGASATAYSDWVTVIDTTNISSYAITSSALGNYLPLTSYTDANVLAKIKNVDGSGSGLDADLLDGVDSLGFMRTNRGADSDFNNAVSCGAYRVSTNHTNNPAGNYGQLLVIRGDLGDTIAQMAFPYTSSTGYLRCGNPVGNTSGTWKGWREFAFLDSNVASATRLQGSYSLWGQTFYGNNVNGIFSQNCPDKGYTGNAFFGCSSLSFNNVCNITFGKAESTGNLGYIGHKHIADNSNQNMIVFGGYSYDQLMCIRYDGYVGIGTTSPAYKLDVNGGACFHGALQIKTSGASNYNEGVRVHANNGWSSLVLLGADNIADSGTSAKTWGLFAYEGNFFINRNSSNGHTGYELCNVNGNWGFGTTTPSSKLHVAGNILATGEVTGFSSSDRRLKKNIRPISNAADIIRRLRPVQFNWNKKAVELNSAKDTQRTNYGLIAQEVECVLPDIVHDIYNDYKSLDYLQLIPILVMMCQELSRENSRLRQRIDRIERR